MSSNSAMRATALFEPHPGTLLSGALLFGALLLAACDRASDIAYDHTPRSVRSIADLRALCTGASVPLREEIVIRGTVVGNDRYGEFSKTLVLQDESGGIAIAAEHPLLANDYPFGACVTVYCNGLVLSDYGGKTQLGTMPGDHGAGRIPRSELDRYIRIYAPATAPPEPALLSFDDISIWHLDTYVRFEGVRFACPGSWCDLDPETGRTVTTERPIIDSAGRTFLVRTEGTCRYAKEPVPSGTGSLTGIIDYFNGKYTLRVVNREVAFIPAEARPTTCPSAGRRSIPTPTR